MNNLEQLNGLQNTDGVEKDREMEVMRKCEENMAIMMAQVTNMISLLHDRDREITKLREEANNSTQKVGEHKNVIPFSEISCQIPIYNGNSSETDVYDWIKIVDDVKAMYMVDDKTIKVLATNKLANNAKKWYDTLENMCTKTWEETKVELVDMFGDGEDLGMLMGRIRARKLKRDERVEDYFHDKCAMARRAKLTEAETIHHLIQGIDNFTIRTQLLTARSKTTKDVLQLLKLLAPELKSKPKVNCEFCKKGGHTSDVCYKKKDKLEPEKPKKAIVCFKCREPGHVARFCTRKDNVKPEPSSTAMLVSNHSPSTFHKTVLVDKAPLTALVDTGSEKTLIKERHVKTLQLPMVSEACTLVGLGGSRVQCRGTTTMTATIDGEDYAITATAVPEFATNFDIVLGQDFLATTQISIGSDGVRFSRMDCQEQEIAMMRIEVEKSQETLKSNEDLDVGTRQSIEKMVRESQEWSSDDDGMTPDVRMEIKLKNDAPVRCSPRRLAYHEQQVTDNILQNLINDGIIRPSRSEYSSPIGLVRKKNNEYRLCVDFRALNKITVRENFPLPIIDDLLVNLSKAKWFTALDLKSGFYHIKMDNESIKYTSFVTPLGQYEFLKMPFGLTNAPSVFQRYVSCIFKDLVHKRRIQVYTDDILIATETLEEHLDILKEV